MKHLQNYMEIAVRREMDSILPGMGVCQCEDCRLDILALALNHLPSHYVVTDKGAVYAKLDALDLQYSADVLAAIAQAVALVKENPRHNVR